ncbi:hypothetical protein [Sphaerimonospora mesophila]|uniref:hypothetical protein n=1 Tax=Sphaerimonospora mesophila TaxID=37483 RepID=UPI000AA3EA75
MTAAELRLLGRGRFAQVGRWTVVGLLSCAAVATPGISGSVRAYGDAGCPHLGETAGRYVDEAKLCEEMRGQVRNWLVTGQRFDLGQAVRNSVRGKQPQAVPEPQRQEQLPRPPKPAQPVPRAPVSQPPPEVMTTPTPGSAAPAGVSDRKVQVERTQPVRRDREHHRERPAKDLTLVSRVSESPTPMLVSVPIREVVARNGKQVARSAVVVEPPRGRAHVESRLPPQEVEVPQASAAAVPEQQSTVIALDREASWWPVSPLTIPVGLAAAFGLVIAYRRRRQLVADTVVRLRRARLTREGDRLIRASMVTQEMPVIVHNVEDTTLEQQAVVGDLELSPMGDKKPSNYGYTLAMAALGGMGLTGPGADDVTRALLLELLFMLDIPVRVLMPRDDAVRLLGEETLEVTSSGLVVLDTLPDVVTELEVEIVRRSGQRTTSGVPEDLPWLYVIATPGAAAERLHRIVTGGIEDLILGVFLGDWPYGITCTVDDTGVIVDMEGRSAPAWIARQLSICGRLDAAQSFTVGS